MSNELGDAQLYDRLYARLGVRLEERLGVRLEERLYERLHWPLRKERLKL